MAKSTANPTQSHLPIAGIQDGVVIMNDGSLRAVLKVEPINFDLKNDTEQNAIIYAYQSFLNSLDFQIQIVVQSKKLDLERYLIKLEAAQKDSSLGDLLRIQTEDYIGFVRRLITVANIMSKRFYIVVSYSPITKTTGIAQFTSIFHKQATGPLMDQEQFERFRAEVVNRASIIAGGIGRLSIKSELLDTQHLIELFYGIYNPDFATEERLTDVSTIESGIIMSPDALRSPEPNTEAIPEPNTPEATPAEEVPATLEEVAQVEPPEDTTNIPTN